MTFSASDVVPLTQTRIKLSELSDQAKAGAEKIITKNGESCVALIDPERLDHYHRLEREHIPPLLLDQIDKGLDDVEARCTRDARDALIELRHIRRHLCVDAGSC